MCNPRVRSALSDIAELNVHTASCQLLNELSISASLLLLLPLQLLLLQLLLLLLLAVAPLLIAPMLLSHSTQPEYQAKRGLAGELTYIYKHHVRPAHLVVVSIAPLK